jgi:hypothetical protein
METTVGQMERERLEQFSTIQEQLLDNRSKQSKLIDNTSALQNALSNNQNRGKWGELNLKRLLEQSGLVSGIHFTEQTVLENEDGKTIKPDFIVNYPDGKFVAIDVKFPYANFERAIKIPEVASSDDEKARKDFMKLHVEDVKKHIKEISSKSYYSGLKSSPEFTILFVPNEGVLAATLDADFNKLGLVEGTGKDIVHFKVALNGFQGAFDVKASVFYQSVPPYWLSDMATYSSAEIDTFLTMFSNTDKTPILIGADSLFNISTTGLSNAIRQNTYKANPNPSQNGIVVISGNIAQISNFHVYSSNGQSAEYKIMERNSSTLRIQLPETNGLYYIVLNLPDRKEVLKVIRL